MAAPGPVRQYLVAFNNGPNDDPSAITTVASPPGTLGAANVWTDVTRWVTQDDHQRGRQQELQSFEAGSLTLVLRNDDSRFTPWNTSSPYTGLLQPRKPVQIRATWSSVTYARWTGTADSWQVDWPDASTQTVTLKASDWLRVANTANITTTGYPTQVLADGAVGYWRLGDPAGSTQAVDSSGHGVYATLETIVAGSSITFGQTGALVADPTTSAELKLPNPPGNSNSGVQIQSTTLPSTTTGCTVEFWMKCAPSSVTVIDGPYGAITFVQSGTTYQMGWLLTLTAGVPNFTLTDDQNITHGAGFPAGLANDGNWHHILIAGSAVSGSWTVYVDGVSAGTGSIGAFGAYTGGGANQYVSGSAVSTSLDVSYQEWAVYPTILSSGQAANHYTLAALPQQSTDARIGRILDIVGRASTGRSLGSGVSTVQAVSSSLTTTSGLAHIQQVEATESGAFFMSADGKPTFLSRQTLLGGAAYTTSQATLGDNTAAGDIPFMPGSGPARDDIFVYNEATAQRSGGKTQVTDDATSIASYGRVTWQPPATPLGISDSEMLYLTEYVVSKYKTPTDRIQSITVDMLSLSSSFPSAVPTLLSLDLLYRVTVERTVMPGGGAAFSQVANIEHIQETITPTQWLVTFQLAIADPAWWVLGTSALDTAARLAF